MVIEKNIDNFDNEKLSFQDRVRRVLLLCCHFTRNVAYYRTGWELGQVNGKGDFWITFNSNCFDIAMLKWCKLFVYENGRPGKHHWRQVIDKDKIFFKELLDNLGINETEFDSYARNEIKEYRDKFVAHLDDNVMMYLVNLDIACDSVFFLYNTVYALTQNRIGLPISMIKYYNVQCDLAANIYKK